MDIISLRIARPSYKRRWSAGHHGRTTNSRGATRYCSSCTSQSPETFSGRMDTPSCSCTMSPKMPIWAARPLLSSMALFFILVASSNLSQPKSSAPLRKSPTNSASLSSQSASRLTISATAKKAIICARIVLPSSVEARAPQALKPAGTSAGKLGKRYPEAVVRYPTTASMEMRPCLSSTSRRRSNRSWSASFSSPRGSKKPSCDARVAWIG
mmetsp:Transcript_55708/g.118497  ORF Transcript_55708/g.118497 Transcript_55708/m.118497 type:complete len:212 (-) Transcript_55708:808-1443(-)